MPTPKIDPKIIFASDAPAIDKPPVFSDKTKGWDVARANDGRPEIRQMNKVQQDTDLKILWLNENAVLPYDASIDYPDGAVTVKDGSFKQLSGGGWVEFLDDFADKDAVKRGIANRYDSSLMYNSGERVVLVNGDIVKSTIDGNVNDPNVDMTGWDFDDNSVSSIAKLRLRGAKKDQRIYLTSVNEDQGAGGGDFVATQKAGLVDNGGTIVSSADPNIFWARITDGFVTPHMFGAVGDGVSDDLVSFQKAVASGYAVVVTNPSVSYYLSNTLGIPPSVSFTGVGAESVKIISAVSGSNPAIIRGGIYGDTGMKFGSFGGFYLQSVLQSRVGIGLILDGLSYYKIKDIVIQAFNQGVYAQDCINIEWEKCYIINNIIGLIAERGSYSHPNAWSFNDCVINGNWNSGCRFVNGCAISFNGGSIEGNGVQGSADNWLKSAIKMEGNPIEGVVGLTCKGVYFEGNKGLSDVIVDTSLNTSDGIHDFIGCTFNRVHVERFTNHNILLSKGGTGRAIVKVSGCGFKRFNDYAADYSRPYINVVSALDNNYHFDLSSSNYYHDANESPRVGGTQSSTKASVAAWVRFNGTDLLGFKVSHNVASVEKISTGKYKITYTKPMKSSGNAYSVTTNSPGFAWVDSEDVSYVTVQINNTSNIATDASLVSVTVYGDDG